VWCSPGRFLWLSARNTPPGIWFGAAHPEFTPFAHLDQSASARALKNPDSGVYLLIARSQEKKGPNGMLGLFLFGAGVARGNRVLNNKSFLNQ